MHLVKEAIMKRTNKPIKNLIIQEEGGTLKTVEKGVRFAKEMSAVASMMRREEFPLSEIILGTESGGSDPTSGLASNPLVGALSDILVKEGATSVLSETTEFIGAEHILARRAKNKEVHDRIYEIIYRYEEHIRVNTGEDVRDGNPSPVNNVYDYSKQLKTNVGLVIMDTPGNDASSVSGMVAGGCQVVVFTTGRGTPTGHPVAPVIKITGNRETYKMMEDNLDFDASPIVYGKESVNQMAEKLLDDLIDYCNGKLTKAESLGYIETAIQRGANFV
jgi:altronate dehydratase large subunit